MTLGQRIQELRKQAGMSQEALGEALGVSRQAVSKWEGDNGIPELDTLIAMSRLFGITVGQLLGVETPEEVADKEEKETSAGFTEEQVEEILRRYVEESRQHDRHNRASILARIVAVCCVAAVGIVALVSTGQIREIKRSINTLWSNVVDIESVVTNVRNQMGGLSDELRGVLEEQSSLISTFDYEVVEFDVEKQTVDFKISTTLKEYTEGSKVQFLLDWKKVDHQTKGELVCDPVEGPKFVTTVTIPMNYQLNIGIRVLQADGTILEQQAETVNSGMHPGEFAVQFRSAGSSSLAETGFYYYELDMYSRWPEEIFPVEATTVIELDGEEVYCQKETIVANGETYRIEGEASLEDYSRKVMRVFCYVTDSFGRVVQFELPAGAGSVESAVEVRP